jgi:hypothetical protein
MKINMDEAYVYRSRTITPLNEVDCTRNVKTRPPNKRLTSVDCKRMPQTCTQLRVYCSSILANGSFKQCQRAFRNKHGEGSVPAKPCTHKLVKKLETTGSVLTRHAGGRKMCDRTVQDVKHTKTKKFLRNV